MSVPLPDEAALRLRAAPSMIESDAIDTAQLDTLNPEPLAASPRPPPPSAGAAAHIADLEREVHELRAKLASAPALHPRQQQQQQQNPLRSSIASRPPPPVLPAPGTPSPCPLPLLVEIKDIPSIIVWLARAYCHATYALSLAVIALCISTATADSPWARCAAKKGSNCHEPYIPIAVTGFLASHEAIMASCVACVRLWKSLTGGNSSSSNSRDGGGSAVDEPPPSCWDAVPLLQAAPTPYREWIVEGAPVRSVVPAFLFRERPRFITAPLLVLIFATLSASVVAPIYGPAPALPGHAALVACACTASAWLALSAAWPGVLRWAWERSVGCSCSCTRLVEEPMAVPRGAGELGVLGGELHELMQSQFGQGVRFRYLGGNGAVHIARRKDFESWARQGLLTGAAGALPPIEFQPNLADGRQLSFWSLMPHSDIVQWRAGGGASAASQVVAGEVAGGSVC